MKNTALLAIVALASTAAAQGQQTVLSSPFSPAKGADGSSAQDPQQVLWLDTEPTAAAALSTAHAEDRLVRLNDFALPGGERIDLSLRPVSALEEGARAVVMGPKGVVARIAPSIAMFSGHVLGDGARSSSRIRIP